jgi:polyisoprenoid-binding protein YceI
MKIRFSSLALAALFVIAGRSAFADDYAVDPVHSGASFQASHVGLAWLPGRFKDVGGTFSVDGKNPSATRFELSAKVDSIDTNNAKRDEHMKSPDFFNAKQFPTITFKSTSVKAANGGFDVTGDLTLHGVTKPVTFALKGGKTAEFPKGVQRTGYSGDFTIKRSDFGMDKMLEMLGDEVQVHFGFEGTKK